MRRVLFLGMLAVLTLFGPDRVLSQAAPRYTVIIVLDGSRPDYFNLVPMPNLHWLEARGMTYSNAFAGQLIAITPTSHATIGTGLFPKHHGIQGFWWKDPRTGLLIRPTDNDPVDAGQLEGILAQHRVTSIASELKAADPSARVEAAGGHKCYASDAMGTGAADYILCAKIYHDRWVAQAVGRHLPPPGAVNNPHWDVPIPPPSSGLVQAVEQWNLGEENDWTVRYALWTFRKAHYPRVLMMNLPETDVAMHFAGPDSAVAAVLMRHFDRELGEIISTYRAAGLLDRTDFIVTADHGMSLVQARLPFSVLDRSIALAGATKVCLEADTGASIYIKEAGKARAVAANVARLGGSEVDATYYKVYRDGAWSYRPAYVRPDLPFELRGAYSALADTAAAPDGPDVLVVYAPHVTTGDRIVDGHHWLAGHLGPQWDDQHIPLIVAGPGVRHGMSTYPARLVDIAPTVEHLLGTRAGWTDGEVLEDALLRPDKGAMRSFNRQKATLLAMVRALQARSGDA